MFEFGDVAFMCLPAVVRAAWAIETPLGRPAELPHAAGRRNLKSVLATRDQRTDLRTDF
jgi:hypothetical protein